MSGEQGRRFTAGEFHQRGGERRKSFTIERGIESHHLGECADGLLLDGLIFQGDGSAGFALF